MTMSSSWFEANPWKARSLALLFTLVLIEGGVRLLVGLGVLSHRTYPTSSEPQFWAYVDPVVGMWKRPDATFRHVEPCFDVTYRSNSFGARDPERSLSSPDERRVVVLGDSFVEGWGVRDTDRLTNRLEEVTGIEHLNFGASGHFSVVQSWLLYDAYAQKYDHSDVFLFILPYNDYLDNHPDQFAPDLYHPFLQRKGGEFEVWYPVEFEKRNTSARTTLDIVKNVIDNHLYISDQLRQVYFAPERLTDSQSAARVPSYYDSFSAEDLLALLSALDRVSELARDRNFYIFTIPVARDLAYAKHDGADFALSKALRQFAAQRDNTRFLDLAPHFLQYAEEHDVPFESFTLGCDMHWNALGNEVAARAVFEFVYGEERAADTL